MYEFTIEKEIADIGEGGKALRLVSWGGRPAKLDLRPWRQEGEELKPGKGLTLTEAEARDLAGALQEYFAE